MSEKLSDNVGKKIVEALKMQNQDAPQAYMSPEDSLIDGIEETSPTDSFVDNSAETMDNTQSSFAQMPANNFESSIDSIFQNNLNQNLGIKSTADNSNIDFELPNNVAILNRLITKLPVGVSKQTGAAIISQTMEALGISMNSVIQEAREVQNTLTINARECQKTIIEYKKQISELESKAQQFQKQAVMMNDVINLFTHS